MNHLLCPMLIVVLVVCGLPALRTIADKIARLLAASENLAIRHM